ncbi:Protein ROT1 [Clarias magur]|uniref:Protein ROT1 n=1 Tax=Clarias magur TaxID=1594786 RepID=A0A8J4XFV8_CLAMG|nr:Protein ROT1 [Clarias magur]
MARAVSSDVIGHVRRHSDTKDRNNAIRKSAPSLGVVRSSAESVCGHVARRRHTSALFLPKSFCVLA